MPIDILQYRQFLGWWSVMTQAAFSFIGTEIVAVRFFLVEVVVCDGTDYG